MKRYATNAVRPLVPLAFAFLAWTGFPVGADATPAADADAPSLALLVLGGPQVGWVDLGLGASDPNEVAQPGNPVALSSAPMTMELVADLPEPSDVCTSDSDGHCELTRNVQERVEYDDGTWGTVSYTCALRREIAIPLFSIGGSIGPFGIRGRL